QGLPRSRTFPLLVGHAMRERYGTAYGRTHVRSYSGNPDDVARQLGDRPPERAFVLVVVHRAAALFPQQRGMRLALNRVPGIAGGETLFAANSSARRALYSLWYAAWVPAVVLQGPS